MTVRIGATLLAVLGLALVSPAAAQEGSPRKSALRVGWAQEPQNLNPFVAQDEENFRVWALNYDLLINFSPKDLGPAPGIAQKWQVSDDRKTVTYTLTPGAKWSDGRPITSEDVEWSLETFAPNSLLFSSYVENISSVEAPDPQTVVVKTTQPDTRMVGGLFVYILPKHVWGEESVKTLTGSYQAKLPLVGSGPWIATEFRRGRLLRMTRNPNFRGRRPAFDEIQWIKYGNTDAVDRALRLGEIDVIPEGQEASFARLGRERNIETISSASGSFTQLAFNLCSRENCPDAKFNPAVQDRAVRQAVGYAVDRERINTIASRKTAFVAHGLLPQSYTDFYTKPAEDYPYDPAKANQLLDAAGYTRTGDGVRSKGDTRLSFDLYVRSESPQNIQAARLVSEMARQVGIEFKVQVVSVDKLTELTTQQKDGKMAPDFDTFIWGWGGDPYDPSLLLSLITTSAIGGNSDSFYSNPEYDRLYQQQSGEFDVARRKEIIERMIAISQRDLPYLVLTVDPALEAYRSDRLGNVRRVCPEQEGDVLCDQVNYAAYQAFTPASATAAGAEEDGSGGLVYALIAVAVVGVAGAAFVLIRRRRRAEQEPLEV
jgi:peptide/nickel transport system substrate-binding protein